MGDVIHLLLNAYKITGNKIYLNRAGTFARMSLAMFIDDSSQLPRASSKHWHYEAITRADNLMMELLRYYLIVNGHELKSLLIYLER